jgi:hypothetical protein
VAGKVLAQIADASAVGRRLDDMQTGLEGRDGSGEVCGAQALPRSCCTMNHAGTLRDLRSAGIHIC